MALQQAIKSRHPRHRIPTEFVAVAPYALISAYYLLLFVARGLLGGDLDQCVSVPTDQAGLAGGCAYFAGPLHHNPWDAAVLGYHVWSSRFPVLLVEYALSHTLWLFVIITFALAWLFIWSAQSLLQIRTPLGLTAFAALYCLLIPIQFQWNAGVYSTLIAYAWTFYPGIFAVSVIAKRILRQPVRPATTVGTVAALVFALCSEQFIAVFTLIIGALAYQVVSRRRTDLLVPLGLYAALWAGAIVNVLVCPGNAARQAREIRYWMPQFPAMSLFDKLAVGLRHTFWPLMRPTTATVALAAVLLIILLTAARHRRTATAYLPVAAVTGWLVLIVVIHALGGDASRHAGTTLLVAAPLVAAVMLGAAEITRGDTAARIMVLMLLAGGFGSAMLLSFSPTIWATDTRTLLLEYLAIVATVFLLARSVWRTRRAAPSTPTSTASQRHGNPPSRTGTTPTRSKSSSDTIDSAPAGTGATAV